MMLLEGFDHPPLSGVLVKTMKKYSKICLCLASWIMQESGYACQILVASCKINFVAGQCIHVLTNTYISRNSIVDGKTSFLIRM